MVPVCITRAVAGGSGWRVLQQPRQWAYVVDTITAVVTAVLGTTAEAMIPKIAAVVVGTMTEAVSTSGGSGWYYTSGIDLWWVLGMVSLKQ